MAAGWFRSLWAAAGYADDTAGRLKWLFIFAAVVGIAMIGGTLLLVDTLGLANFIIVSVGLALLIVALVGLKRLQGAHEERRPVPPPSKNNGPFQESRGTLRRGDPRQQEHLLNGPERDELRALIREGERLRDSGAPGTRGLTTLPWANSVEEWLDNHGLGRAARLFGTIEPSASEAWLKERLVQLRVLLLAHIPPGITEDLTEREALDRWMEANEIPTERREAVQHLAEEIMREDRFPGADRIRHRESCPGPRIESFPNQRPSGERVTVTRCINCGGQVVVPGHPGNVEVRSHWLDLTKFEWEADEILERINLGRALMGPGNIQHAIQDWTDRVTTWLRNKMGEQYVERFWSSAGLRRPKPPEFSSSSEHWILLEMLQHRRTRIKEFMDELRQGWKGG